MNHFSQALVILTTASLLTGCAVFSDAERAQLRQSGLAPATLFKLERREPLGPDDLLELSRRGVRDPLTIRQLSEEGVDSLFTREDFTRLRRGGVSAPVLDAAAVASERFAHDHRSDVIVIEDPYREMQRGLHGTLGWGVGVAF